jgi:hypothetical protein
MMALSSLIIIGHFNPNDAKKVIKRVKAIMDKGKVKNWSTYNFTF